MRLAAIGTSMSRIGRRWRWVIGGVVAVIVLAIIASFFIDEPLRRTVERQMNHRLKGYTARIQKLSFHPIGGSLDLIDVVVVQNANPDPPVMRIPLLHASVQWRELIHGRVVADFLLDRPRVFYDRRQAAKEAEDKIPPSERGWQDALEAVYPFKINLFRINDADITYLDANQARPLRLTHVDLRADNIRNIKSREHDYPSPVHLSAAVFETGRLVLDGHADFLAEPYMGMKANFDVTNLDLAYFKPILERNHLVLRRGVMSGKGTFEFAPGTQVADIRELTVDDADVDYVRTEATAAQEQVAAAKAHEAVKEVSNQPGMLIRASRVRVTRSTFGMVNTTKDEKYRVFLTDTDLTLTNVSNQLAEGTAVAALTGKFMGSGATKVAANFRPQTRGPDFDVDVKIEQTDMRTMRDLMRAYGKIDMTAGIFSLYSQLAVKNGTINGYIKPLFKDLHANVPNKEEEPSLSARLKAKLVNAASKMLKNRPRREVATVAQIHGPVDDPKAGTMQVVVKLVQNAFFKAILPGFEKEAEAAS